MLNVRSIRDKKPGHKIVMLTAYDFAFARLVEKAGADIILVGDSLGMVFNGHGSTLPVTVDEMIYHAKAVRKGARDTFMVVDMPFMSYQESAQKAKKNAGRIMKETGAQAVKVEGGAGTAGTIKALVDIGIPVMGHIGTQPQSVNKYGGYVVSGSDADSGSAMVRDALAVERAGAFAIVIEKAKKQAAASVAGAVKVPVIGIGAGPGCDGQVLVTYDLLGLFEDFNPKFVKKYEKFAERAVTAMGKFAREVRLGRFPGKKNSY